MPQVARFLKATLRLSRCVVTSGPSGVQAVFCVRDVSFANVTLAQRVRLLSPFPADSCLHYAIS